MYIEGTSKTFEINFDTQGGLLEIKGKSTSENPKINYKILMDEVEKYATSPVNKTVLNMEIEYINSSSSRYLLSIFRVMEELHQKKLSEVCINWYYEEDDEVIFGLGQDYQGIVELEFNLIELDE